MAYWNTSISKGHGGSELISVFQYIFSYHFVPIPER